MWRLIFSLLLLMAPLHAGPTPEEQSLIRDAEIEDTLKSYIDPIFKVAGLDPKSLHLYVIYSKDANAMAMGGGRIAVFTGLITKATKAQQIIGVLAHETAHLAGQHVIRGMEAYQKASLQHLLATVGGMAAGLAIGHPELGQAIAMGSEDVAMRGILKFSRTQEGAADQGATRFLDALQWTSSGLPEFLHLMHKDDLISHDIDPYLLTHPLTPEREEVLQHHVQNSPHKNAGVPKKFEDSFERMKVKILAFTESLPKTLSHYSPTDNSLLARYARAIAYFQASQENQAMEEVDSLLHDYPKDAFFWDLKGQILFESGKVAESIKAYEKAIALRPDIPLLRLSLAHAFLESNDKNLLEKAFGELTHVRGAEPENPFTHHLLAIYYGKTGQVGLAALSLAEMAFETGDFEKATSQAKRALHLLKDVEAKQRATYILEELEKIKKQESWL